MYITKSQAKKFLLYKHGLVDDYKYSGVSELIKEVGCIQYDPVDVCGKNYELVLFSRIKNFTKKMLYDSLYVKLEVIEHFDKNLSIYSTSDWPLLKRLRNKNKDLFKKFNIQDLTYI